MSFTTSTAFTELVFRKIEGTLNFVRAGCKASEKFVAMENARGKGRERDRDRRGSFDNLGHATREEGAGPTVLLR